MSSTNRSSRLAPLPLATLAALVAIMAATSSLPDGAVVDRPRGWTTRPIEGNDPGPGSGRTLTDCLAQAARDLLVSPVHLAVTIAPLNLLHLTQAAGSVACNPQMPSRPPADGVVISHLALPPPLA